MRTRAGRLSLAVALTAAMAVAGLAGSHAGMRLLRPGIGTAVAPAHAAVAGLPGLHGHHVHERVAAVDVLLGPATLLAGLLVGAVVVRRSRRPLPAAPAAAIARGPPAAR